MLQTSFLKLVKYNPTNKNILYRMVYFVSCEYVEVGMKSPLEAHPHGHHSIHHHQHHLFPRKQKGLALRAVVTPIFKSVSRALF